MLCVIARSSTSADKCRDDFCRSLWRLRALRLRRFGLSPAGDCRMRFRWGALGEVVITWGLSYALFFTLLSLRHMRMPAVLCFLGKISYSIYLLHVVVIQVIGNMSLGIWWKFTGWISVTFALSTVTYYLVEEPGIRLGRWLETLLFPRRPLLGEDAQAPVAISAVINP